MANRAGVDRRRQQSTVCTVRPASHTRVPAAIDDLMTFAARDDVPLLAQIAVAHAQFETIHPFTDGNGRTGRALVQAMLRNKGLTRQVTVPVSAGLLVDTDGYIAALTAYRDGDATDRRAVRRGECAGDHQRPATGHRTAGDSGELARQDRRAR